MTGIIEGFVLGLLGFAPFVHANLLIQLAGITGLAGVCVFAGVHLVSSVFPAVLFASPFGAHAAATAESRSSKPGEALRVMFHALFWGLLFAVCLAPFVFAFAPAAYAGFKPFAGHVLLLVALLFLSTQRSFFAFLCFALSGCLGFLVFSTPLVAEPLFPLLSGLFAVPALLAGNAFVKSGSDSFPLALVFIAALLGAFSPFLPAVSPALLAGAAFLFLGGAPFLAFATSLAASKGFYDLAFARLVGVARSGAAVVVREAPLGSAWETGAAFCVGAFACLALSLALLPWLSKQLERVRLGSFNLFFLAFLFFANLALGGPNAVFVLGAASAVGLLPVAFGVARANSMGALLVPSLLYFYGLDALALAVLY
ncbi:MAG: hypothetical protein WC607_03910 [Candidatus Micrarchaeia archaeon]